MPRMAEKIKIMEDNRTEQTEALETLLKFNGRLINNMQIIVKELSGNRLEDTDKFLKSILDAINWEIQVVNGTMDVLNEGEERVNKETFNDALLEYVQGTQDWNYVVKTVKDDWKLEKAQ